MLKVQWIGKLIACCAMLLSVLSLCAGCTTTLEDGYKPRTLDATPEARKAYYASPFTDNAEAGARGEAPGGMRPGGR